MKRFLVLFGLFLAIQVHAQETVRWTHEQYTLSAQLYPAGPRAVIVVHGTGGPDNRGIDYARALNQAGITAFVVDFKTGVFTGPHDRNRVRFLPMLASAYQQLASRPEITSVGLLGMSLGGVLAVHSKDANNYLPFKSSVALYPVCKNYIDGGRWAHLSSNTSQYTREPMLIIYGTKDTYGEGTSCPKLQAKVQTLWNARFLAVDAHHGFERKQNMQFQDPDSASPAIIEYSEQATQQSHRAVIEFFKSTL